MNSGVCLPIIDMYVIIRKYTKYAMHIMHIKVDTLEYSLNSIYVFTIKIIISKQYIELILYSCIFYCFYYYNISIYKHNFLLTY